VCSAVDMVFNSSSTSSDHLVYYCSKLKSRLFISVGMASVKSVLILPLCTFILYLGHQRWRQQRSFQAVSHSDLFTYHLAVIELFWGPGVICYYFGTYIESKVLLIWGLYDLAIPYYGEVFFHLLTCMERYLAAVHPVIYLGLRNARGIRIRNIAIGSVWMLCFGLSGFNADITGKTVVIAMLSVLIVSIVVITFCSISVLCVLVRPRPGGNGRQRKQINQSKLRAFHSVTAISCVLWVWFGALFVSYALSMSLVLSESVDCVLNASVCWFNLPTSLVLPLLYLHREGKLFRKAIDSN
ncbi:hypothetical protein XENOCAPTIV_022501, partial [Xenoophorus captivus]